MADKPEQTNSDELHSQTEPDRRKVLEKFVQTGKYAAPVATVLLLGTKQAAAMSNPDV
ncbi:MAG: hypothetical protein AAGF81_01380 [Pseudomonadota bacterium]